MADNKWTYSLFGCFADFRVCLCSYFLPCYVAGKNAEAVGESCLIQGVFFLIPILHVFCPAQIRGLIRGQKGIPGTFCADIIISFFCPCCSLAQQALEINSLGGGAGALSIARQWRSLGNMERKITLQWHPRILLWEARAGYHYADDFVACSHQKNHRLVA